MKDLNTSLEKVYQDKDLSFEDIVRLLSIGESDPEVERLGEKARSIAYDKGNTGKLWAAIGIDYVNCKMNCDFCSMGEKWNDQDQAIELSEEMIMNLARAYVDKGVDWLVLRTTEFYSFEKLAYYGKKIKEEIPGDYCLTVNTGNDNTMQIPALMDAGFEMAYHAFRLREGEDTKFNAEERIEAIGKINESELIHSQYLEPIGPEHTNEELARRMLDIIDQGTKVSGIMPRIPIKGSKKYNLGILSDERIAQISAIFRIVSKDYIDDIIIHPKNDLALKYGINSLVVDIGAIPRAKGLIYDEWDSQNIEKAKDDLARSGYLVKKHLI